MLNNQQKKKPINMIGESKSNKYLSIFEADILRKYE